MQLRLLYNKALIGLASLAIIISITLVFFHMRPKAYELINDTYYARAYFETFGTYLLHQSHHAPQYISQSLLAQYKELQAVEMRLNNQFVYQLQLIFYKPVVIIEKKILLENGTLIPNNIFTQLPQLPNITIKSSIDQEMGKKIAAWVKDNATLLSKYDASWVNTTKIFLKPQQERHYILVVRHDQPISSQLLGTCKQIIKQIEEESKTTTKGEIFITDLRFRDQIIIAKKKGDYEGEII